MSESSISSDVLSATASIVASYVSRNQLPVSQLPDFISQVYGALTGLGAPEVVEKQALTPAVPIRKSVTPEFIVCLEDGKKLKMLKRHLMSTYNMSPDQYRDRWNLPQDYPMVAPNYAKQRSSLAKQIGLGTKARRRAA